jgi:hypothetical protein
VFFLFLTGSLTILKAQRIGNFSVSQTGTSVAYHFVFRAGSTCNGYQLLRSSDSLTYLSAVDYLGICGSSGADEPFDGVDNAPKMNAWNYYKIQLPNFETSNVQRIYVSNTGAQKAIVFPNPSRSENELLQFRIQGANNIKVQGFVYDQRGVNRGFIDLRTNLDAAPLDVGGLENGLYILWLTDGSKLYKGKFALLR